MMQPKQAGILTILFLGGAKRVAMARMLKDACRKRDLDCKIIGYELDTHSALAIEGDIVPGLRWSDPEIFADLNRLCTDRKVDIILPFVDSAVGIAAEMMYKYPEAGVFSPVSPRVEVDRMFDKCAAAEFFSSLGLPIPATYDGAGLNGPLIAKPRFGSASKGIIEINDSRKLDELNGKLNEYLIQERIDHREEITVDCYVGVSSGRVAAVSPRLRREVSGGEAVRTITIDDEQVVELAHRVLAATGLRGAITIQFIRNLDNGSLMVMEINPRLGGGAVASVHAGVDLPGLIIDDACGRPLTIQRPTADVETVRYLADVVFYPDQK